MGSGQTLSTDLIESVYRSANQHYLSHLAIPGLTVNSTEIGGLGRLEAPGDLITVGVAAVLTKSGREMRSFIAQGLDLQSTEGLV